MESTTRIAGPEATPINAGGVVRRVSEEQGSGTMRVARPADRCPRCKGAGRVRPKGHVRDNCPFCRRPCSMCEGTGTVPGGRRVTLRTTTEV